MLVLSRKQGERVVIDERITVTIVTCEGGKVKLGIDAPQNIAVDREEIHLRKQREQRWPDRPAA